MIRYRGINKYEVLAQAWVIRWIGGACQRYEPVLIYVFNPVHVFGKKIFYYTIGSETDGRHLILPKDATPILTPECDIIWNKEDKRYRKFWDNPPRHYNWMVEGEPTMEERIEIDFKKAYMEYEDKEGKDEG